MSTTSNSGGHPKTTAPLSEAVAGASRPETFRLPKGARKDKEGHVVWPAERDPFFGFSRTFYYEGEQRGYWRLIRIRERGKLRGITLVPFDAVATFIRKQMEIESCKARKKPK
jgi:hypothetical protein